MPKQSPHDDGEIAPGTVVDGRYRIVRAIGQGGNGMVYEVEHARTGRKLALKALLDETGFARLEQEARAASLMKNGHTARIIDMEAGGPTGAYMVMELLEGQSLRALLDDAGQLPLELTVNIAMQVCECLHEAHALGIIHRDLKPENVFLCHSPWPGQYDVKVLDFGVMKIAEGGGAIPKSSLTRTGSTVGTPYYMSLEQLRNSSAVDARADVYSLGVVLYECLSGRKPFQADTIGDLVYALCSGPPTHLTRLRPDVQPEMAEMVMHTLSANRDDRPASMLDLALALLPNANQAFALWVKVDGKQPALARGPSSSLGELGGQAELPKPPTREGFAPKPPAPKQALPTLTLEPSPRPAAGPPDLRPRDGGAPRPAPPAAGGRRDTPTEMFVKGVHGGVVIAPEAEAEEAHAGDRDTPTRAIPIDALIRTPALATLKSPIVVDGDDVPELPTFDLRDGSLLAMGDPQRVPSATMGDPQRVPQTPPGAMGDPQRGSPVAMGDQGGSTGPLKPGAATAKLTIPLGAYLQNGPQAPTAPSAGALPTAPPPSGTGLAQMDTTYATSPFKPAWQQGIDRALIRAGRFAEAQSQRFRAAPQNTQIIVVIVAGTITILVLGLVVFFALD